MKTDNILLRKSFTFALDIIRVCRHLEGRKEFVLSRQLLRSGTSVGANAEEAVGAQSPADFYNRITIAYKEAREAFYWIRLLLESGVLAEAEGFSLAEKAQEILRILSAIQKTLKRNRSPSSIPNS